MFKAKSFARDALTAAAMPCVLSISNSSHRAHGFLLPQQCNERRHEGEAQNQPFGKQHA